MGVYVFDMEMPTSCYDCGFAVETYEGSGVYACAATGNCACKGSGRQDDCPLVYVPPHGRLIDADALHYNRIRIAHPDGAVGGWNAVVMSAEIKDAPTIIPAEPVEEGET